LKRSGGSGGLDGSGVKKMQKPGGFCIGPQNALTFNNSNSGQPERN
jgi:hypothetical protein